MPTLELSAPPPTAAVRLDPNRSMPLDAMVDRPLVSVLVASYNYARFLPAALDGLVAQTYPHWEAVVVDDGSTDDSSAVVRRYAETDNRIRLVRKANGGQNSTVNEAHRHARGDVVCLLDADDTFSPMKIARVVAALGAPDRPGLCVHFAEVIDDRGAATGATLNARLDAGWLGGDAGLSRGGCVCVPTTSCLSFRREVLDGLMPLPVAQPSDADGYLCMAAAFLTPLARVDDRLGGYRVHGTNMGGLTAPTPARLRYELGLIRTRTDNLKTFLADRFGRDFAGRVDTRDNPQYVRAALKLAAVDPAGARALGVDAADLMTRVSGPWRLVWKSVFALPASLRPAALSALHNSHGLKALGHRMLSRGGRE